MSELAIELRLIGREIFHERYIDAGVVPLTLAHAADRIEALEFEVEHERYNVEKTAQEAAKRIKVLEAALRHIAREGDHVSRAAICNTAEQALSTGAGQMKKAHDELPEDNAAMWTELEKRAARIEALEAALDRAVTRGLEQVEHIATLEAALLWVVDIADKHYEQDHKLRSEGARTLKRISDRSRAVLAQSSPPKENAAGWRIEPLASEQDK